MRERKSHGNAVSMCATRSYDLTAHVYQWAQRRQRQLTLRENNTLRMLEKGVNWKSETHMEGVGFEYKRSKNSTVYQPVEPLSSHCSAYDKYDKWRSLLARISRCTASCV